MYSIKDSKLIRSKHFMEIDVTRQKVSSFDINIFEEFSTIYVNFHKTSQNSRKIFLKSAFIRYCVAVNL
jgi:hypothetical protein